MARRLVERSWTIDSPLSPGCKTHWNQRQRSGTTDSMTCLHLKIYEIMLINSMNHCETMSIVHLSKGGWDFDAINRWKLHHIFFPDHFESQLCFKEPACLTTLPRHQKTTLPMRLVAKSWHGLPQGKHSKRAMVPAVIQILSSLLITRPLCWKTKTYKHMDTHLTIRTAHGSIVRG